MDLIVCPFLEQLHCVASKPEPQKKVYLQKMFKHNLNNINFRAKTMPFIKIKKIIITLVLGLPLLGASLLKGTDD